MAGVQALDDLLQYLVDPSDSPTLIAKDGAITSLGEEDLTYDHFIHYCRGQANRSSSVKKMEALVDKCGQCGQNWDKVMFVDAAGGTQFSRTLKVACCLGDRDASIFIMKRDRAGHHEAIIAAMECGHINVVNAMLEAPELNLDNKSGFELAFLFLDACSSLTNPEFFRSLLRRDGARSQIRMLCDPVADGTRFPPDSVHRTVLEHGLMLGIDKSREMEVENQRRAHDIKHHHAPLIRDAGPTEFDMAMAAFNSESEDEANRYNLQKSVASEAFRVALTCVAKLHGAELRRVFARALKFGQDDIIQMMLHESPALVETLKKAGNEKKLRAVAARSSYVYLYTPLEKGS